jgi:hypothetical protein
MGPGRSPIPRRRGVLFQLAALPFVAFPLVQWHKTSEVARTWIPVPAVVLSKEFQIAEDEEGRTYIPRIRYAYRVGDTRYESSRFDVLNPELLTYAHQNLSAFAPFGPPATP